MATRKEYKKTKYPGIYEKIDNTTKIKTYLARIKVNGIDTEQIVGYSNDKYKTTPLIAYNKRNELIEEYKNGNSIKIKDNPTLDIFLNDYIDLKKGSISPNWIKNIIYFYNKHIPKNIKNKKFRDISESDLQKIINRLIKEDYSGRYIKSVKDLFYPLYKRAIALDIVSKNLVYQLSFPKFDNERKFYLSEDKARELYKEILNIPKLEYRLMFILLMRGRRKGEVLSLCWEDINFEENSYIVRDTNNKIRKNQKYILDSELIEHLEQMPEDKGLIFKSYRTGRKYRDIPRQAFKELKEKVGITDMKIHDFRHLFGGMLINNEVPIEIISKSLGHQNIRTTQRYSKMKEEMAKKGVDTFLGILKK
jgi:integrase